ncbi:hypothetical protein HK27_12555 [Acetobacter orientalis]|nr:hypothetical protein HK27_12555 [Acetobacter orientalis]
MQSNRGRGITVLGRVRPLVAATVFITPFAASTPLCAGGGGEPFGLKAQAGQKAGVMQHPGNAAPERSGGGRHEALQPVGGAQ